MFGIDDENPTRRLRATDELAEEDEWFDELRRRPAGRTDRGGEGRRERRWA
jgi:hypothetical protein